MQKITPCLWFDDQAEEAAHFYVSVFKDGKVGRITRYDEASAEQSGRPVGSVLTVEFEVVGHQFIALNGGPIFKFSEAVSFSIDCKDQAEVDYYWDTFTANGGAESQCGWLKDKFGLSWQVVPSELQPLLDTGNPKVMQAMLGMKKIIIADIQAAARAV